MYQLTQRKIQRRYRNRERIPIGFLCSFAAESLSAETMHMFTINDGLVSKFQGFDDTAAIAKSVKTRQIHKLYKQ